LTFISVFSKITNINNVYKALGDPTRRRILELLRDRDMTAGELAEHFNLANDKQTDRLRLHSSGFSAFTAFPWLPLY
jgi:DNA-binding transcriptional ArsR family regulator